MGEIGGGPAAAAAASSVRPSESDVSVAGRAVLQAVYAASRLGALWGFESKLAEEALSNLSAAIRAVGASQGDLTIRFANDLAYLNEHRLRVDFSGYAAFKHVHDHARRHGIGEITLTGDAARRDLIEALKILESRPPGDEVGEEERYEAARDALAKAAVTTVGFGPVVHADGQRGKLGPADVRQAAAQAYLRLVFVAKQSLAALEEGQRLPARRCRRAVHDVIDVLQRGPNLMLALTQVKNYHGYAPTHAANVCVLACAVGLRTGMHKLVVADLGVAALLHEPLDHDAVAAAGTPESRDAARDAARALLPHLGFGDGALRAVLAARDLRTPARDARGAAPLFQRILRVVCFADNQTTPAGPGRPARTFHEVVSVMERCDGTHFDTAIVRSLKALLGIVPFGTVVKLRSGERAIVYDRAPGPADPMRPIVRIFESKSGMPIDDAKPVDLSERDPETGAFLRHVVSVTAPCHAFARPSEFVRIL